MTVVVKCDGCDVTAPDASKFQLLGRLVEKQYCELCAELAAEYLAARNEVIAKASAQLTEKLAALKHSYRQYLEDLPDVADRQD